MPERDGSPERPLHVTWADPERALLQRSRTARVIARVGWVASRAALIALAVVAVTFTVTALVGAIGAWLP